MHYTYKLCAVVTYFNILLSTCVSLCKHSSLLDNSATTDNSREIVEIFNSAFVKSPTDIPLSATLFCMNFKVKEFEEYIKKDLHIEDINIEYLFDKYGFYSGKEIINIILELIKTKYDENITFSKLYKKTKKELVICVTDLKKYKIEYLTYKTYPN